MKNNKKKQFLVVYDTGMMGAGIWAIVDAESEDEIKARYPELIIAHERPPWMNDAEKQHILDRSHLDINDTPTKPNIFWLVITERTR